MAVKYLLVETDPHDGAEYYYNVDGEHIDGGLAYINDIDQANKARDLIINEMDLDEVNVAVIAYEVTLLGTVNKLGDIITA